MNKQTRIEKIQQITGRDQAFGNLEIPWEDKLEPMNVYKIPLDYLIYNKYNGRILSRTKSLESQHRKIDAETKEGRVLIEKLLWDSNTGRNEHTLKNIISTPGQQKPGIITRDGVIIDGNRRAMLLRKSEQFDYFKAVVLPITQEENPLEIEKLETTFQMGEDEKLGYNPIEKYLKAKGLYLTLAKIIYSSNDTNSDKEAIRKISAWMGEDDSAIKEYLEVMNTMDDYLDYLEYNGIYTQLDGREDQFIQLTRWLKNFYGEGSSKAFDGYRDDDVDDLKIIAYDYIRIKYEGKKFRNIAYGQKENHFFGDENIWASFRNFHFKQKQDIREEKINLNSNNLEAHLNDRDNKFYELSQNEEGESFFDENVDNHYQQLKYKQSVGQPEKLLKNARKALESINPKHKSFTTPAIAEELESLNDFVSRMLKSNSSEKLLSHIIKLLKSIEAKKIIGDREILIDKATEIQHIAYQLCKDIKKEK
jgi:hypothetical protein